MSLSLSEMILANVVVIATTTLGCAGTVTPPDSTPVYADEIAPGVAPIEVEMQSTNDPEPRSTAPGKAPNAATAEGETEKETPSTDDQAAPADEKPDGSTPEDADSPETSPPAQSPAKE